MVSNQSMDHISSCIC